MRDLKETFIPDLITKESINICEKRDTFISDLIKRKYKYIVGCILLVILDQMWIAINYDEHKKIIKNIQKKNYKKKYIPFILAIILLLLHFTIIIYHKSTLTEAAIHGFILHGIINSYNYAYFDEYNLSYGIIETIYGVGVIVFVTYIIQFIGNN